LNNQEFSTSIQYFENLRENTFLCIINFLPICSLEGGSLKRQSPGDALWRLGMASGVLTIPIPTKVNRDEAATDFTLSPDEG
jgi:hypothetical protein